MNYGLTLVTAPTGLALTPQEAGQWVRVATEGGYFDEELTRLVKAATQEVERLTSRQLLNAIWELRLDRFPYGCDPVIYIPKAPFNTLTASEDYAGLGITYIDAAGDAQTLATSVYKVITSREPGEIRLKSGQAWPTTYSESDVVAVRFLAGYGDIATDIPEGIRQAIRMIVDDWFERRMGEGEIGPRVMDLLASHTVGDEFHAYAG